MADSGEATTQRHLSGVREILPQSASIIEAFRRGAGGCHPGQFVLHMAYGLADRHQQQWNAEDVSRAPGASAEDIASSKRLIDEFNACRVAAVDQIDQWVAEEIPNHMDASLHTETLGSVVDRLAIAWVRASTLINIGASRERARLSLRQLAELAHAYDDLVRDVATGRRRLPAWRPLKTYRTES
jgi:hypothetical protein